MPGLDSLTLSRIGASYGAISVALGAFGAHGLQKTGIDERSIRNWGTASHYLMLHALALLVISGHPRLVNKRFAAGSIALGSALFSGSIYGLILAKMKNINVGKVLGPITPIGGSIMLAGWIALIL